MTDKPSALRMRAPNFTQLGLKARIFNAFVEPGITPEMVKDPVFWASVAPSLVIGDIIVVCAQDTKWAGIYIVSACERTWAQVVSLSAPVSLETVEKAPPNAQEAEYDILSIAGSGFRVIRKADKHVISDGLPTKQAAKAALTAYLEALRR